MNNFEDRLDVKEIEKHQYMALYPTTGANFEDAEHYLGNIVGQALVVAIKSSPSRFSPHSIHSYFTKSVSQVKPLKWEVEEISNGNNFCCRCARGFQDDEIKFIATISLTKNNSLRTSEKIHQEYEERERSKVERMRCFEEIAKEKVCEDKDEDEHENNNEDDHGEAPIMRPFYFSTPYPSMLKNVSVYDLPDRRNFSNLISERISTELISLEKSEWKKLRREELCPSTDQRIAWFVRLGPGNIRIRNSAFQFPALAFLSSSIIRTKMARYLWSPDFELDDNVHFDPVSTDHIIFFHDVDFDTTEWMGFAFKVLRLTNGRFLLEAHMYNSARHHVATIYQEGLIGVEREARL